VVADDVSYALSLADANALSTKALQDYQDGKPLTTVQIADIRKAVQFIDEANLYRPNEVGPYILSGKAHAALGDYAKAIEKLRQGIANIGTNHSAAMAATAINAHYEISRDLFALGDFPKAYAEGKVAAQAVPGSPEYQVAWAKAALQVNKPDEAKEAVAIALAVEPDYAPARVLAKYLHLSPGKPKLQS
jgi:tetratricopeptide (TPR) repeat protein